MFRRVVGSGRAIFGGTLCIAGLTVASFLLPLGSVHAAASQEDGAPMSAPVISEAAKYDHGRRSVAQADGRAPATVPRRLTTPPGKPHGPYQRAHTLYLGAMEELDAGRKQHAQEALESLISRYPDSPIATMARRQLGALYRAGPDSTPPAPDAVAEPTAASQPAHVPTLAAGPAWEQELRRNAAIQVKLRSEVGDRVFFSEGSAELGSRARAALSAQAQWLNRWREFEAAIEGHADEPGSEADNVTLAARRAEAVRRRLVEEGVEAARLSIVAQGRARRFAICPDPACAAQNRRALTFVFASGTRERLERSSGPVAEALGKSPARALQLPAATEGPGAAR